MSQVALDEQARGDLVLMDRIARRATGRNLGDVRPIVAEGAGIAPGTAERIRKRRVKGVRGFVADRIEAALIAALRAEIVRLEGELELVLARGSSARSDAAAALAKRRSG